MMDKETIVALRRAKEFLMNVHPALSAEAKIKLERVEHYLGRARDTSAECERGAKSAADISRLREMQSLAERGFYGDW